MEKKTEKKKASAAHMRATAKWEKENYFRTMVRFPKDKEKLIRAAAETDNESLNNYIVSAVLEKLERTIKE